MPPLQREVLRERIATEEAAVRMIAVCPERLREEAVKEAGRRSAWFSARNSESPYPAHGSPGRCAFESVAADLMSGRLR